MFVGKNNNVKYEIKSIDIIENEVLEKKFEKKKNELKAKGLHHEPL